MGRKSNSNTLNPEVRKIRLCDLEKFCGSKMYRQFPNVPITPSRALSYLNNPNGNPEDVVLFLAFAEGEMIAFRSLFAGVVQFPDQKIRFGWCSGSWVHPYFRRRGISLLLLKEAFNDWDGRLMLTNYSPATERLFLKTGWFKSIHKFNGARFYLFPKTFGMISWANNYTILKPLFSLLDVFIHFFARVRIMLYRYEMYSDIEFELLDSPDEETFTFLCKYEEMYLFNRNKKELLWIFRFPWISETNHSLSQKYPFSSYSESFYYKTVKIWRRKKLTGVVIFSVREGHLKTLFLWIPVDLEDKVAEFLKNFAVKNKLEFITVYQSGVARRLLASKFPFLHSRKLGQKIYSSFEISNENKFAFHDGDGDRAFT